MNIARVSTELFCSYNFRELFFERSSQKMSGKVEVMVFF